MKKVKAWHFSDGWIGYGDERLIEAGKVYEASGPIELCSNGMHASISALHALGFRKGTFVSRVELTGEIISSKNKLAARYRRVLWCYDAADVLQRFARLCALDVVHLWDCPDVVLTYLRTGNNDLRSAAYDAAYDAADAAAAAAAAAADAAATHATTHAAACAAANAAANAASYDVDYSTAYGYIRTKQRNRLYRMLMKGRPNV